MTIVDDEGREVGHVDESFTVHLADGVDDDFAAKVERAVGRAETATRSLEYEPGELPPPEEGAYVSPPEKGHELRPLEERLRLAADHINDIDRELPLTEWPPYRARVDEEP